MSRTRKLLVLTGLCTACPEIEPVPISGNESAEIARSVINTSVYLKESRTCEQLEQVHLSDDELNAEYMFTFLFDICAIQSIVIDGLFSISKV